MSAGIINTLKNLAASIMNRKKVIILVILIIGAIFLAYYFNRMQVAPVNQISITKIDSNEKIITIEGCFINSIDGFAKAKVKREDKDLIITIYRYNALYRGNREGSFKITIDDDSVKEIKKIYLDDSKTKKKIADFTNNM